MAPPLRSDRAYVRTQPVPPASPPAMAAGPIAWMRRNLFATPFSAALTLLTVYLLYLTIPPLIDWAFVSAVWEGHSNRDCQGISGACWAVIEVRFDQFIYGFYPVDQRWRVNLTFVLFLLNLVPILSDRVPGRSHAIVWIVTGFPLLAYFLLHGGLGLSVVETDRWGGLMLTLVLASVSILLSLPFGILLALGRRSTMPIIRIACIAFIELWRAVPLITVLFMSSFMLPLFMPEGVNFDELVRALVGFTMFASAYMAEVVRGGLQALPKGQNEAARALGLGFWQSMRLIVLPQALKIVIPGIVNTFIGLFKDTTLVVFIGLLDPIGLAGAIRASTDWQGIYWELFIFIGLMFFIFCFSMGRYSLYLEKKLQREHR